ncbi:hypothetical protein [Methanosarcina barkeri]|uniref:hypothetical protein n=1 Tax=Methanosarcina barkeri TaxID=2208 RepID=UPI001FB2C956|nr:hypothetical protein [Methanosarcina barkeri]
MYAEASFEENSARFRHMLLAAAGKLEKAAIWQRSEDNELKAYALYFLGLFFIAECITSEKPPIGLMNA